MTMPADKSKKPPTSPAPAPPRQTDIAANDPHDQLEGMSAICAYVDRSPTTVLGMIRSQAFPAGKVGSVWNARKSEIDAWKDMIRKGATVVELEQRFRLPKEETRNDKEKGEEDGE